MHGAGYHKYSKQRKYLPLWLRAEDANSICSLAFQLKIDYAVQQLTALPVSEEDVRFTWVQISGAEPLEFSDWHAAQPYIVLNPDVTTDSHFKVYIDKGEATELVSDLWIYRTPTEKTLQYVEQIKTSAVQSLRLPYDTGNHAPSNIQALFPSKIYAIENIKSGTVTTADDIVSYQVIGERNEPASSLIGMKVEGFKVFEAETGSLVGFNTNGELSAVIPRFVSTFYVQVDISVYNGITNATPRNYTITSEKVYSTPLRKLEGNEKLINLYASEKVYIDSAATNQVTSLNYGIRLNLPQTINMFIKPSNITYSSFITNKTSNKRTLTQVDVLLNEFTSTVDVESVLTKEISVNRNITRYNGITIGG